MSDLETRLSRSTTDDEKNTLIKDSADSNESNLEEALENRSVQFQETAEKNKSSSGSSNNNVDVSLSKYNTSLTVEEKRNMSSVGNRSSMMSDYSGVVQHVDIDTIRYVVDKSAEKQKLRLSDAQEQDNSSIDDSNDKNTDNLAPILSLPKSDFNQSIPGSTMAVDNDLSPTKTELSIPARSAKRPQLSQIDSDNMIKMIKVQNESPSKKSLHNLRSSPPKSPLPLPLPSESPSASSSPLRKSRNKKRSSVTSDSSSKLQGHLDTIMKEVEDLKFEIESEDPNCSPSDYNSIYSKKGHTWSLTNSVKTGESFHTARSNSNGSYHDEIMDDLKQKTLSNEPTEILHFNDSADVDRGKSTSTLKPTLKTEESFSESTTNKNLQEGSSADIGYSKKSSKKSASSGKHSHHHQRHSTSDQGHSKSSSSSKSRKKYSTPKNKLKPFSYDTLARLLNATDGIVIGQEFANLNIPTEEKFLIERIVDSISRLTANMMLNPNRYDQSCARLERVLNALEGFE